MGGDVSYEFDGFINSTPDIEDNCNYDIEYNSYNKTNNASCYAKKFDDEYIGGINKHNHDFDTYSGRDSYDNNTHVKNLYFNSNNKDMFSQLLTALLILNIVITMILNIIPVIK